LEVLAKSLAVEPELLVRVDGTLLSRRTILPDRGSEWMRGDSRNTFRMALVRFT
jgi:hypothetical protein